ncbi:hypothetical protein [Actinomadura madurae]|uniref:hypothetical protein n=1 Tax=Actinomadura madurae TaxID=1993 RepID=UPI0032B02E95
MLFAETGLSPAAISSLFVIWSVTTFSLELPSGVWADVFSRRLLLVVSPLLAGAGFGLWVLFPSYAAFAVGFVLWGAGSALRSGTMQALVYERLERVGAAGAYARLMGRSEAVSLLAVVAASAVASPVLAVGVTGRWGRRVWRCAWRVRWRGGFCRSRGAVVRMSGSRRLGRWCVRGGRRCGASRRCGGRWCWSWRWRV